MTARDFVPDAIRRNFGADADDEEDEYWEVDFALVVKAFLSYKVPFYLGYNDVAELTTACKLVRNFLNYVCSLIGEQNFMLISQASLPQCLRRVR